MAIFGYRQTNSSGQVQIDQSYQNLVLIASGTTTCGTTVSFAPQTNPPLVAIGVTSAGCYGVLGLCSTTQFRVDSKGGGDFSFPYRVYAPINTAPAAGTYGMRVFNAAGDRTFDSNFSYLNVRYVAEVSAAQFPSAFQGSGVQALTIGHSVGGSPFAIMNGSFITSRVVAPGNQVWYFIAPALCLPNNTQVTFCEWVYNAQPITPDSFDSRTTASFNLLIGT